MKYRARAYTSDTETLFGIERLQHDGRYLALFGADGKLLTFATEAERNTELARLNGDTPAPEKKRSAKQTEAAA
jgi:hypothetical protein